MTDQPHVLVVDDEEEIRCNIRDYLALEGLRVTAVATGTEMRRILESDPPEVLVLDVRLSGESGLDLAAEVRRTSNAAILMLSQKDDVVDRVAGLEVGADDYLTKPFHMRELLARIRSQLRRQESMIGTVSIENQSSSPSHKILTFAGWQLNRDTRQLYSPAKEPVDLSSGEIDLLLAFLEHPNHVLSRDQLLDFAHNREAALFDRSVDVQVGRLRRKIEVDPKRPAMIKTVRGAGYTFAVDVEEI